jgi:hypothetical protein
VGAGEIGPGIDAHENGQIARGGGHKVIVESTAAAGVVDDGRVVDSVQNGGRR